MSFNIDFDIDKIWDEVQGHLSKQIKGPSYQTWIRPSKLVEIKGDKALLEVKNEFNKNFLKQAYLHKIALALEKVLKKKIELEIVVNKNLAIDQFLPSIATLNEVESPNPEPAQGYFDHTFRFQTNLNPSYSFESFVVGPSNQFCHAAALVIAESITEQYNPLFIYGGVGLGKTHLAHAIANFKLDQGLKLNIKYLSSEAFTNELIHSIRTDGMGKFREKYRKVDILMIDDIQFLAGKEATQEEFFHTFNTLRENGKQIILTSDRPPTELSLTDRLKNRFEGGLITDMQVPDLETRIAILCLKAQALGIDLNIDVGEYIASIYPNNIRELEGALKRIHAYFSFTQEEITIENVRKILSGKKDRSLNSHDEALKIIASYYDISVQDLISENRSSHLATPRHIAIYFLHSLYNLSFPRIGEIFSNRTHSSAIYSEKLVRKRLNEEEKFAEEVNSIKNLLERR